MYEASDIKVGQVLLCIDTGGFPFWTKGKRYEVVADEQGKPCLYSDSGEHPLSHRTANDISVYLNSEPNNGEVVMQIVEDGKEEPTMTKERKVYTLEDIKEGMVLRCTDDKGYDFWTTGKEYTVYSDDKGVYIENEIGDRSYNHQVLIRLNGKGSNATMEVVSTPDEPEEITLTITGADYYKLQENLEAALDLVEQINYHTRSREEQIKQLDQFKGDK